MSVIESLKEFLSESEKLIINRKWIDDDDMKVYVRKSRRLLTPDLISVCLDIASVEVEEEKQGKGIFSSFLEKAHEMNPWDATYIECVVNQKLRAFLEREGWTQGKTDTQSFFLLKHEQS